MAYQVSIVRRSLNPFGFNGAAIGRFFSDLSRAHAIARTHDIRQGQIDDLNTRTDAELDALGVRREDIARHVYRDLFEN